VLDDASKQRLKHLCDLIAKEQDHQRFSVLVAELNDLLESADCAPRKEEEKRGTENRQHFSGSSPLNQDQPKK
jgi:hypothetical protein